MGHTAGDFSNYNVIGCAGGEHCVCVEGFGHKKYAQTPIPQSLAEKDKRELVRIVEMMQEDVRWYVHQRNSLLAERDRLRFELDFEKERRNVAEVALEEAVKDCTVPSGYNAAQIMRLIGESKILAGERDRLRESNKELVKWAGAALKAEFGGLDAANLAPGTYWAHLQVAIRRATSGGAQGQEDFGANRG